MSVELTAVHDRWKTLRELKECDLSLAPEAVARYIGTSEPLIVKQRILESLIQFADYRIRENKYHSGTDDGGDLATCEGLETFLIPAVEEAYRFSEFLRRCPSADAFAKTFKEDMKVLLTSWNQGKGVFSGKPYTNTASIRRAMEKTTLPLYEPLNVTEAAAMACRVVIHVLTLKYHSVEEEEFQDKIGRELDDEQLFNALANGINFLIDAFQKNEADGETEERIANSTWGNAPGSGWSWTANPPGAPAPLPPMLFFSAAAVDAFAELDLYLIRPACSINPTDCAPRMRQFYKDNAKALRQLQLCVDMARRWVRDKILPNLTSGDGQYRERYPDGTQIEFAKKLTEVSDTLKSEWKQAKLTETPALYYHNLYALQILLWSFADRTDNGKDVDDIVKSLINRALTLLVSNYDGIPVVRTVLGKTQYAFLLPGKGVFKVSDADAQCEYIDAGFLPLMTRLLVLFVVYGVGDRNLLEPIIRDLYVELLQRRNRELDTNCGALWSTEEIEVYSTQRAIQSLTFYHAYAAGKELVESRKGGGLGSDGLQFRNKTGRRVILEFVDDGQVKTEPPILPSPDPKTPPTDVVEPGALFKAKFGEELKDYLKKEHWLIPPASSWEAAGALQERVQDLVMEVFAAGRAGDIPDLAVAKMIIDGLLSLWKDPAEDRRVRDAEFELLKKQYVAAKDASAHVGR